MKNFIISKLLYFSIFVAVNAAADTVEWSTTAMTCTPSASTASEDKYVTTAGVVKFKPNTFGQIVFLCSISRPLPSGLYFLSSNIEANSVRARGLELKLRSRHKTNGGIRNIISASAVSTSNNPLRRFSSQFPVSVDFDFSTHTYWVQITMKRPDSSSAVPPPILNADLIRLDGGSANVSFIDKHKVTAFDSNDLQIVHVEVDDDAWVTFKGKKDDSGSTEINSRCISCRISNISQCAKQVCPGIKAQDPNASCSDAISRCTQNACRSQCSSVNASNLTGSFHGDLFNHVRENQP